MAQYPSATGGDSTLYVAKNNLSCSLSGAHNAAVTTITVNSTTGFPTTGYITIDAEAISYSGTTGTTFTGCTRGADGTTAASYTNATQVYHNVVADHHNVLKDEIVALETDIRGAFASITPVTAANTSTTLLIRLAHIVSQIKNGFGLTNWYDTVTAMLPKSGGTMSGNIAMGSNKVTGLAAASTNGDALRYEQAVGVFLPLAGGTMSGNIAMGSTKLTGLAAGSAAGESVRFEQLKVLQTVAASGTTQTASTSTSYAASVVTGSITPTSSSNRVKVTVSMMASASNTTNTVFYTLERNTTDLLGSNGMFGEKPSSPFYISYTYIDSPATTSATSYTVYVKTANAATTVQAGSTNATWTVVLEEIV